MGFIIYSPLVQVLWLLRSALGVNTTWFYRDIENHPSIVSTDVLLFTMMNPSLPINHRFLFLCSQKKSRNQFAALERLNNDMDMEDMDDIGDEFIEFSEEMAGMYLTEQIL